MADNRRYLIGQGERLTTPVQIGKMPGEKVNPYTFAEARERLVPKLALVAKRVQELPREACPNDEAVAMLTLHPSYLARSYFPKDLLAATGLRSVGSRARSIRPEKFNKRQAGRELATAELYVAGKRSYFEQWAQSVGDWTETSAGAAELARIEDVRMDSESQRVKMNDAPSPSELCEAVLHCPGDSQYVFDSFVEYVNGIGGEVLREKRQYVGGLCYVPLQISSNIAGRVAEFAFLRLLRNMPVVRSFEPFRSVRARASLPNADAVNGHLRVAIFDGGLAEDPDLRRWSSAIDAPDVGAPHAAALAHGLGVTSAALYGRINDPSNVQIPYANIDHYRVIDVGIGSSGPHYYDVLSRIEEIIRNNHYDFINISLGPDLSIEDHSVHLWTAKLDALLSHGKTLATIAVGNRGDEAPASHCRIGPPSDSVNALGVGSSDSVDSGWRRPSYSSIGPGRSPGVIKPDVVSFGGCPSKGLFELLVPGSHPQVGTSCGTSFASPNALRTALGVAAYFGQALRPLAIKALLIHHARQDGNHIHEVGHGRIADDYLSLVLCSDDTAHVVYQGVLYPGKFLRARIPLPSSIDGGKVSISATLCYATEIEPENPVHYTRAGVEIVFRPHSERRKDPSQTHADSKAFFQAADINPSEVELREDAHKWETTLKKRRTFLSSTLNEPVFDIHYVAREGGASPGNPVPIPYAMIVSIEKPGMTELYDLILQKYRTELQPLQPRIGVPIRV